MLEIYNWIRRVINSCDNLFQLLNTKRLIERFRVMYGNGVYYRRLQYHYDIAMPNFSTEKW